MTFNELSELLESNPTKSFGQGVSDAEIDIASVELEVELTGGYRLFLKRFGWGGVGSIEIFGLGVDVPPYLSLLPLTRSEREEMTPALPVHLIPLMNDGGGNLYCLDSRGVREPSVVFWEHTAGEQQEPTRVASDFTMWLAERIEREVDMK
ncbi:SMI1/KNR4 family protein [Archangium violaceum]|uniref:SMI1/KNR4 family protein n=1 Tax=Archangium violaceum TaxID=83451 RepID=UPI0036D839F8